MRVGGQTVDQLVLHRVSKYEFKGKRAIKIVEDGQVPNGEAHAVVKGTPFHNGTIEVEMAGLPPRASEGARGFIGLAFRLRDGRFEHLPPTNQWPRRRPGAPQSLDGSSFPDFDFARPQRSAGEARELRGSRAGV